MAWILVTGGVASGIGKGVAAAMIGRRLARQHGMPVDYRKVEPCLQADISNLPNDAFGEIVQTEDAEHFDGDVARARFWIPGFRPDAHSGLSLGRLLPSLPTLEAEPRLLDRMATEFQRLYPDVAYRVVEVGGTAGEPEHALVVRALVRALGRPWLHAHVTTMVNLPNGRTSSKAAQLSLDQLPEPPTFIFVRGSGALEALRAHAAPTPVLHVVDDAWPERAWHQTLNGVDVLNAPPDPVLDIVTDGPVVPIDVVSDVGIASYESLRSRLWAWTGGRVRIGRGGAPLRIGEREVRHVAGGFSIVPSEIDQPIRSHAHRPDWHGTADVPTGALAEWLSQLSARADRPLSVAMPYAQRPFADVYLAHSRDGQLRDHRVLAELLDRALPLSLAGLRILDVGCGDGRLAARFVAAGADVVGVEPSAPMADAAAARNLPSFELSRASAESMDVAGPFDFAVAWMSLDHCAELQGAMLRIARTLRPGGRLVVCTEHALRTAPADGVRWTDDAARVRDYSASGWRNFYWFGREEAVPVYHRPIGEWVTAAQSVGLQLAHLAEPDIAGDHGAPRFQLFVFERPDPTNQTITLDGPAGCGKSTLARAIARAVPGLANLDTGVIMRTLALASLRCGEFTWTESDGELRWLVDGHPPTDDELAADEVINACRAIGDDEVNRVIGSFDDRPRVIVGRSWGRTLPSAVRLWLETPLDTRAARRGVPSGALELRDDADRQRGRLAAPDVCARILDGRASVDELADQVVQLVGPIIRPQ